jgi:hypothetical protein
MKRLRGLTWVFLALGSGTLFSGVGFTRTGLGGGCASFATNGVASMVDTCFLLDCEQGFFGGALQPCGPVPYLIDCPGAVAAPGAGNGANGG